MNYHDRPEISRGMLVKFMESPRLYEALYVTREINDDVSGDNIVIGSLTHQQLLEPHIMDNFVIPPKEVLASNGARLGNAWKEFEAANSDKLIVRREDFNTCQRAVQAVRRAVGGLIDNPVAEREKEIYWTDETGLQMRAKFDLVVERQHSVYVADIKTCAQLEKFTYQVRDGLWLQWAHYTIGAEKAYDKPCTFCFIVVEKSGVFRVRTYTLPPLSQENARTRYRELVDDLAKRYATGNFAETGEGQVIELDCCL